ncbi:MAG: hypothetical protein LM591_05585 [Candidatus Korarchaeum sp.]|nr:hypothetical protein [Candidatus Korarchaeum sp.]
MVGKVGEPRIIMNDRLIELEREVGFGGRVRMRLEPSDILKLIFSH